ncbi:MAG: hypothetical protein FJY07_01380, partial [Bacteroidetes bacterium]|nr:hypothetical protein [Bacteroidota bacterium]
TIKLKEEIKDFTENPSDVEAYFQLEKTDDFTGAAFAPDEFPNFNGQPVEYVIITNETLAEGFQEIADWKIRKGVPAVVKTVEWIYGYYPGADQAEKVHNFIIDAYQNWGALYFILGGDSEQLPIRYAWMGTWSSYFEDYYPNGPFIPADMYFACLDGNWNADGDATFGEADWDRHNDGTFAYTGSSTTNLDDVDRWPEVYLGRVPVEDYLVEGELIELNRFKTKFFEYVKTSQGNENNCLLFSSLGSIGTLKPAFPTYMSFKELYSPNATNIDVLNEFNGTGPTSTLYHIICGLGHGGPTGFHAAEGSLNRTHMDELINSDRSQILYLGNFCTTMPWDKNTVTEHYLNSENGGVAVIANTCVGWASMVTDYNKEFIQNIYNVDHLIGNSFNYIKTLYHASSLSDCQKRLQFFALSLAADPEMPVWTDSPDPQNPLLVNVPANVYTGQQTIPVQIDNLTTGTEAIVCLYRQNEVYAVESVTGTGGTVTANLDCTPDTEGEIMVTVTAKNFLPVETTIQIIANPGIHLFISEKSISGDENIDAGETVELSLEISNSGQTNATGVYAILSCEDDFITIQDSQSSFGNITAGGSQVGDILVFDVDANLEDNTVATFTLEIHEGGTNIYDDALYFEINLPVLEQRNKTITYTSGNDLIIEAGETVLFNIDLFNSSRSYIQNVNATLSSSSPYVTNISQTLGAYGDIASFETGTNITEFEFEVSGNYPGEPEPIEFFLEVENEFDQQWSFTFDLLDKPDINGMEIDFRGQLTSITLFWTIYDDVIGYNIYRSEEENGPYQKLNTTALLPIPYFENSGLPELTQFYYKVSVVSLSGNESDLSSPKLAWTSLAYHPDWFPVTVSSEDFGSFWGAPNIYDMDNDGEKEIFITSGRGDHGSDYGAVFGFKHDGEELFDIDENPTTVSGFADIGISMTCTPAIGDIDNDGIIEIVVATRMGEDETDPDNYKLFVYKNIDADDDNKPDLMWEKFIHYKNFNGVVLADLNNNGDLEILVPNQWGNEIEIFDCYGNNYPGWPVTTSENPIDKKAVSIPVAVDLDGDNSKEIVIGIEGGIYIWNQDGTDFITGLNPVYTDIGRLDCPVVVADIDNDNDYEILFMSIQDLTGYIYAIESDGSFVTGWGNNTHNIDLSIQSQTWAWPPAFVCGDIDLNGNIEVVIADEATLKVWSSNGNLILNKSIPGLRCKYQQPSIVDIYGMDNDCEIILPSNDGIIYGFHLNGDPVLGWPLYLGSNNFSVPLIDDIDNDSKNE